MTPVKIMIADDHRLFREGLRFILESSAEFTVISEVENGRKLMSLLETSLPDLVLLDIKMPGMDGIEAIGQIKAKYPALRVIVLTMYQEENLILHMLDLGANGYLIKNTSSAEVAQAIRDVMSKDYYFTDFISKVMLKGIRKQAKASPFVENEFDLTPRELEVLKLICLEHTTGEIAEKLFISDRTVETHRKSLLEKLKAKNTAGLVVKALKMELVDI